MVPLNMEPVPVVEIPGARDQCRIEALEKALMATASVVGILLAELAAGEDVLPAARVARRLADLATVDLPSEIREALTRSKQLSLRGIV